MEAARPKTLFEPGEMVRVIDDPFNDFKTYFKSPLYLLRGELIDPMFHVQHEIEEDDEPQPAH